MIPPDPWTKLARRARHELDTSPAEMPFGFDTRVLAAWRSAAEETGLDRDLLPLLRRLVVAASAVLLFSLAVNLRSLTTPVPAAETNDLLTAALFAE